MIIPDLEAGLLGGLKEVKVRKAIQEGPSCTQRAMPGHAPGQGLDPFYLPLLPAFWSWASPWSPSAESPADWRKQGHYANEAAPSLHPLSSQVTNTGASHLLA